jgi:hypothetical protein
VVKNAALAGSKEKPGTFKKSLQSLVYTENGKSVTLVVLENELHKRYFISIMDKD